jgi:AraC family transcriptional regulator
VVAFILAHKYAVFRFIGFFSPEQVNSGHFYHLLEYMYTKWIIQASYDFAAQFRLENIDNNLAKGDYCKIDIYQPIKELDNTSAKEFRDFSVIIRK